MEGARAHGVPPAQAVDRPLEQRLCLAMLEPAPILAGVGDVSGFVPDDATRRGGDGIARLLPDLVPQAVSRPAQLEDESPVAAEILQGVEDREIII